MIESKMQYKITRKRIKNIIIRLDKYGNIKVSAPYWAKIIDINNFVESNKNWIETRQKKLINNIQRYENGIEISYFEHRYILKLMPYSKSRILQNGNYLEIWTPNIDDINKIEKLVLKWYISQSQDYIDSIISKYGNAINRDVCGIRFRRMTTRWGSCNVRKATISLNSILFSKPKICLEYVLLHELVHLIHANHSRKFYDVLESLMPNWRKIKNILET
ncbi:hypothetical protein CCY99_08380 [Helicobacter sp. 16-1353]|uniref:M48 family metallopeptidase n=1 Tax=Helicobacter sp. 16-1353 TaxID=2004996 RepID=UPI000DCC4C0D|nr:SprT family zinc-dependent metalloprotease [Helicobacter sp. 16-1353]RAX51807.1 hypothetical protein CCY99_08380 [Helicobacter sp. 16-1353]